VSIVEEIQQRMRDAEELLRTERYRGIARMLQMTVEEARLAEIRTLAELLDNPRPWQS
jgi:hypothetical protein